MNAQSVNCPACGCDLSFFTTLPRACPGCGAPLTVAPVPPRLAPVSAPTRPAFWVAFGALMLAPPLTMLWSLPHFKKDWPLPVVLAVTLPCALGAGFVLAKLVTKTRGKFLLVGFLLTLGMLGLQALLLGATIFTGCLMSTGKQ